MHKEGPQKVKNAQVSVDWIRIHLQELSVEAKPKN